MNYPLISEYVEAIKSAEDNFNQLKNLRPVLDNAGNPIMTSGNFAVVFKMENPANGKRYAVKCFIKDQEGRSEAYRLISEELKDVKSDYLTSFQYLEKELFVDTTQNSETEYPVLVMDWVEGVTLGEFIRDNREDKYILRILAYRFSLLAEWLLSRPFAHGDLKPDNIIVQPGCWLTMVDYDGMYVPAMKGQRAREIGSPDFQHPARTEDTFDEHIDDFPIITILLSVKALSIDPGLLEAFGATDRLLLSAKDYHNIGKSRFFNKTYPNSDVDFNRLVALLHFSLAQQSLQGIIPEVLKLKEPEYDMDYPNQWIDEVGVSYSADGLRLLKGSNLIINYCCHNGIISIDDNAFSECAALTSISLPNSVVRIGDYAFDGCENLTNIVFPDSVTNIGFMAFYGCIGLTSIIIPKSVAHIGDSAFVGCVSLSSIIVNSDNPHYDSRDNCNSIIETENNTLILGCKKSFIPHSVTSIEGAFDGCEGLTEIIIPNSVTSIGNYTFRDCSELIGVVIPESVTHIGEQAFHDCIKLMRVELPNSLIIIGSDAFEGCISLTSVSIPESVTHIGSGAFRDCFHLKSVNIPQSITSIEICTFAGCESLASVFIPNSITVIGECAFSRCTNLTYVSIPESVTFIGDDAFERCSNLTTIVFTNVNTIIGYPLRVVGSKTFYGCDRLCTIIIPIGAFQRFRIMIDESIPDSVFIEKTT